MKKASKKKPPSTTAPAVQVQSHFDKWRQMEDFATDEAKSYSMRHAINSCLDSICDLVSQDAPNERCEWYLVRFLGCAYRGFELFSEGVDKPIGSLLVGTPESKVLDLIEAVKFVAERSIRVDIPIQPNEVRSVLDESGLPSKPWTWITICDEFNRKSSCIPDEDQRKQKVLELWNAGRKTWLEIAKEVDKNSDWKALSSEIHRYAEKTQQHIREGKRGLRKK
jgi:hypothetical protein